MKQKLLSSFRLRVVMLVAILCSAFSATWAAEEVYKTALFGSSYNSKGVSGYSNVSFDATNNDFKVNVANFNNNNNGWNYVKCGGKNGAYTGTITTDAAIDKPISKVSITIDAITASNVTSIKLYTSKNKSSWTEAGTFDKSTGAKEVSLSSPAENLYYKLEFVCTKGSSNGLVTVSKVEYYNNVGGNSVVATPAISGTESFLESTEVSITCATDGAAIKYSTDNGSSWTNYNGSFSLTETTTVKAKATKEGMDDSVEASMTFTKVTPMTVAEAIAAIDADSDHTIEDAFVLGIVSQVDNYNSTYHSITYWISDDGTTTNQFEVYSGKGVNGANFSSEDDVQVGDVVVIKGDIKLFNNSIYEFNMNSQLVSHVTKASPELSFATSEYTVAPNASFEAPELTNPHELTVTYGISDNNNVASVDPSTGAVTIGTNEGQVTVTASFAGNADYRAGSASYTITVVDNTKGTIENPYTVADLLAGKVASDKYVKGFIVGSYGDGSRDKFDRSGVSAANLALADDSGESNKNNTAAIQLVSGSAIRTAFNTQSKPYNIGIAQVVVKGSVESYLSKTGIKSPSEMVKVAEQVNISSVGMGTYYTDCALDFTGLDNMYAYIATVSDDAISFTRVNKVPANTGLLLSNPNKNTAASNLVPVTTDATENVEGNKFVGTLTAQTYNTEGYYILNDGSNGLGFYQVNKTSGSKVGVHRAYLDATSVSARAFIGFDDDSTTTGIEAVEGSLSVFGEFYNLNGQRVVAPQKGLYIVNGKKVLFK